MSIIERLGIAIDKKDKNTMKELLHDDYKFTMHASGNVLKKQDVIDWAMSDDIKRDKVRILYENDEVGIEHAFVTFSDGNVQAVMGIYMFKDGQVIEMETGATNIPKEQFLILILLKVKFIGDPSVTIKSHHNVGGVAKKKLNRITNHLHRNRVPNVHSYKQMQVAVWGNTYVTNE